MAIASKEPILSAEEREQALRERALKASNTVIEESSVTVPLDLDDPELRKSTHGPWSLQSTTTYQLKTVLRSANMQRPEYGMQHLSPEQLEALEMILLKVSRAVCGDPHEKDHWDDIQGYAKLGRDGDHKT